MSARKTSAYARKPRHPIVAAMTRRWWWLVVPLFGIVCAEAYVTPHVADSKSRANRILKYQQDKLDELNAEWTTVDNEWYVVESTIDTTYMPNYEWHVRTRDSLMSVRQEIESQFPLVETQIATLKGQLEELRGPLLEVSEQKTQIEGKITDLRESIATFRDSLATLAQEQDALSDRLYRLQHPEEFDRSRALVSPGR